MASAGADAAAQARAGIQAIRGMWAEMTKPDGPFPLAEEEVEHWGTVQRYRCWQKNGPNSLVHLTLPELFGDSFTRFADKEFLVYEGERLTYGKTMEKAAALSRELKAAYGIQRGQCIAIAGRNHPDWVISLVAVTGILGAIALPVNSWWMGEELRYGLEDSKSVLLIADKFVLDRAPFLEEIGVQAICMRSGGNALPGKTRTFEDVVQIGHALPPLQLQPCKQDDIGMLMYTSGTTSKPKGVVLTQRSIMAAMNMARVFKYAVPSKEQEVVLVGSPLFHVNGSHVALLSVISCGAKLAMMYKWDAGKALEIVQREKVNSLVGVPTMTYELASHPDHDKYDTSSLVGVGGGGAAFAAPMIKRVNDKFKNAKAGTGYGLTETNALSVVMPAPFFPLKPTSCGTNLANVDVCILGEKNEKLPAGEMGEICFRGATVMKEYWGKPEKTEEVFHIDAEGRLWFRSGDLGMLDEDGFVYIMDRAKDIIIRGGENISCGEVEDALLSHPAVLEAAAVGVPSERLGEEVAIAVVLAAGSTASAEELRKHAAGSLAPFKVPSEVHCWEGALPRGATGKIQKRDIREQLKARKTPQSKL